MGRIGDVGRTGDWAASFCDATVFIESRRSIDELALLVDWPCESLVLWLGSTTVFFLLRSLRTARISTQLARSLDIIS